MHHGGRENNTYSAFTPMVNEGNTSKIKVHLLRLQNAEK